MITYKKAGVDIDKADRLIQKIKKFSPDIGGFSGLFPVEWTRYRSPVLVSSTDGVGTKLKIAFLLNRHDTVGIDLVAMVVNDIITSGAKPLFFLDYFACGKLDLKVAGVVLESIARGCRIADCRLVGGETAEMPGMYRDGEYDLAGFGVGIVEKEAVLSPRTVKTGDILIGLPSSGVHSNGFSLIRKVFSGTELKRLGRELLTPTRIYVEDVRTLMKIHQPKAPVIKGIAHITGGGITDNLPRVLPRGKRAVISRKSWQVPWIFKKIQSRGKLGEREMYRTFNMGIGMILVVEKDSCRKVLRRVRGSVIGEIRPGREGVELL